MSNEEKYKSYIGQRFGNATVIDFAGMFPENPKAIKNTAQMLCRCEKCGNTFIAPLTRLKQGRRTQCSKCQQTEAHKKGQETMTENRVGGTDISLIVPCRKMHPQNKSGVTGVYFDKTHNYWIAKIQFQYVTYNLGCYKRKEDAVKARKEGEQRIFGDFVDWYKHKYPDRWERLKKRKQKRAED